MAATELRDQIDAWCSGTGYALFLQKFIPVLLKVLDGQPVFISTSPEQVSLPALLTGRAGHQLT